MIPRVGSVAFRWQQRRWVRSVTKGLQGVWGLRLKQLGPGAGAWLRGALPTWSFNTFSGRVSCWPQHEDLAALGGGEAPGIPVSPNCP